MSDNLTLESPKRRKILLACEIEVEDGDIFDGLDLRLRTAGTRHWFSFLFASFGKPRTFKGVPHNFVTKNCVRALKLKDLQ